MYRGSGGQESACATLCGTQVLRDVEVNGSAFATLPLWQYKWGERVNQGVFRDFYSRTGSFQQ